MDGEMKLNEDEVLHQPSISVQDPAKHSFSFEAGHFRPAEMGHLAGVCACHRLLQPIYLIQIGLQSLWPLKKGKRHWPMKHLCHYINTNIIELLFK